MISTSPKVIISFDCEGRWGVADHLTDDLRERLRNQNLVTAYREIVDELAANGLDATFAFAAAVLMSREQAIDQKEKFQSRTIGSANFADAFLQDLDNDTDGWLCPELIDIVRSTRQQHEIACHGFSHVPWESGQVADSVLDDELRFAGEVFASFDEKPVTFIYPRNKVHAPNLLQQHGYIGYRRDDDPSRRSSPSFRAKVVNKFADDLFRLSATKTDWTRDSSTGLIEIPAGYFVPWRVGYRKSIPLWLSQRGFRQTFDRVIQTSDIFHLWIHPWNLIGAPETKTLFFQCLETIGRAAASGTVSVVTQQQFCDEATASARRMTAS